MKKQDWYELWQKWQKENLLEAWDQGKLDFESMISQLLAWLDIVIHDIPAQRQQISEWMRRMDDLERRLEAIKNQQDD